ncbi:hypothetical protein H2201_003091 [Coniosporium apollinis]|uniref:Copper acquisition factor BIM1-like domain-containing protein n=1 Tax=Coniosporium apollinis TaxID=61459 RepID=A0ABQ9NX67_9PEZI|nr:hypothetical protein H2201_003091 [Coniosporium apollinis]
MLTHLTLPAALLALLPLASAHFELTYPPARGFDDSRAAEFPCGGFNTPSATRTPWPLSGGPIQLEMGHTEARVQVLLALGDEPGSNFNIVLVPTVQERGPEDFCFGMVTLPSGLNVTEGQRATVQVVTNGDPAGGLYQCADIIFTSQPLSQQQYSENCRNSSGVTVEALQNAGSPNETSSNTAAPSGSASGSQSSAAASATAASSALAAPRATLAAWAMGAVGVIGGLAAL